MHRKKTAPHNRGCTELAIIGIVAVFAMIGGSIWSAVVFFA
jgi:hypothetical protein